MHHYPVTKVKKNLETRSVHGFDDPINRWVTKSCRSHFSRDRVYLDSSEDDSSVEENCCIHASLSSLLANMESWISWPQQSKLLKLGRISFALHGE